MDSSLPGSPLKILAFSLGAAVAQRFGFLPKEVTVGMRDYRPPKIEPRDGEPRVAAPSLPPAPRVRHARLVIATLPLMCAACIGPAMALSDLSDAKAEIAAAKSADAEKWAPYEYTSATLYLAHAKALLGRSGSYYQEAFEDAEKAEDFAHQAKEKAENHPKD